MTDSQALDGNAIAGTLAEVFGCGAGRATAC